MEYQSGFLSFVIVNIDMKKHFVIVLILLALSLTALAQQKQIAKGTVP
jgi:hypothetical protein